jgi:hypothetical protein
MGKINSTQISNTKNMKNMKQGFSMQNIKPFTSKGQVKTARLLSEPEGPGSIILKVDHWENFLT